MNARVFPSGTFRVPPWIAIDAALGPRNPNEATGNAVRRASAAPLGMALNCALSVSSGNRHW